MTKECAQLAADDPAILAPCGINCSLCRAYVRDRRRCPGCLGADSHKSAACVRCGIKNCPDLVSGRHRFCFSCARYPCADLRRLDKRYRIRYGVSVVENLARIKAGGEKAFLVEEAAKWSCAGCGSRLCMHKPECMECGVPWRASNVPPVPNDRAMKGRPV